MQMQSPKTSAKSSSDGARKNSPRSVSSDVTTHRSSGRAVRQLKTVGLEANSSSNQSTIKIIKNTSPKVIDRRSPRSPISELHKTRSGRVAELEAQISQLQDALKTVKDQLVLSESWKEKAKQDAEESRKQLLAVSLKLEESQKLLAQSSSEEPHGVQVLKELSEAGDEEWKSKLEAIKKQHSATLDALGDALNKIDQLQVKLDTESKSEATQTRKTESAHAKLRSLKENMAGTVSLIEDMKNQLQDCRSSESQAQALARETLLQLETSKKTLESLELNGKTMEDYNAIALELDQSRARVSSLEQIVNKLKTTDQEGESEIRDDEHGKSYEEETIALKSEAGKLKYSLEIAEIRYNEEQSRRTVEITSAYELIEEIKSSSKVKETELEDELKKSKAEIEELKANLMDKETELQGICGENEDLNTKLENSLLGKRGTELEKEIERLKQDFDSLKSKLMTTEADLHNISDENEKLKLEIKNMDCKEASESEKESLVKVDNLMEEIEKSNEKVARTTEQLEVAQTANFEMEAELRRLKVQSDQWRKAAETAATMLSNNGNNNDDRKLRERRGSMDNYSPRTRKIGSPYGEDIDVDDDEDEFLKKKNGNMLKRIGVLWKKPQNK